MKKAMLAIAVLGTLSGAAYAEGSSVQLYGLMDLGLSHFTGVSNGSGGAASSTGISSGGESGTRIGVKGTEDLGGGLDVIYDAETGFCAAGTGQDQAVGYSGTGASNGFCTGGGFMQRQSWAGLQGGFGTVTLGRQYTLFFLNEAYTDPFGYGLTGNVGNLSLSIPGNSVRSDQTIEYVSPSLSGITVEASYSFAPMKGGTIPTASASTSDVPRSWSLNGEYAGGPVKVGVNYTQFTNETMGLNPAGYNNGKYDLIQGYGSYDFGVATISALYERAAGDYADGTTTGISAGDDKFWMLGATVPVGRGSFLASYGQLKVENNSVLEPSSVYGTAKQYAVGYTYALSKQTDLYASYGHITNDSQMAFAVGSAADSFKGVAGQSSSGTVLGMRVKF